MLGRQSKDKLCLLSLCCLNFAVLLKLILVNVILSSGCYGVSADGVSKWRCARCVRQNLSAVSTMLFLGFCAGSQLRYNCVFKVCTVFPVCLNVWRYFCCQ